MTCGYKWPVDAPGGSYWATCTRRHLDMGKFNEVKEREEEDKTALRKFGEANSE
jgi:hypothetical protein